MDVIKKEKIEVMRRHMSDGIFELVVGFIIMSWAILSMYADYFTSITLLPMFFIKPLKSWITYPRLGYYVTSFEMKRTLNSIIMVPIFIVMLLGLLVITNHQVALFVKEYECLLMIGLFVCSGMFSFATLRNYRYLWYTIVSILSVGIVYLFNLNTAYALISTGGVLLISGLVLMGIFITKNPIQAHE